MIGKLIGVQEITVSLLALQMSFDTAIYLTSIVHFVESIAPGRSAYFLDVAQACGAASQIVVSLSIGYIARWTNTMKWVALPIISLSAVGNFLYSCAGAGALNSAWIIVIGRILSGIASGSGGIAYSYIAAVYPSTKGSVFGYRVFRNSIALYMMLAQILSIALSYCDFKVGDYNINSMNAPTFITSFLVSGTVIILAVIMENPRPSSKMKQPQQDLPEKCNEANERKSSKFNQFWAIYCIPLLTILENFIASFLVSILMYMFPLFYTLLVRWKTQYQSIGLVIVLFVSTIISILIPYTLPKKRNTDYAFVLMECHTVVISLIFEVVGFALMISTYVCFKPSLSLCYAIGFTIGMICVFTGYNCSASCLPSIYKQTIPKHLMSVTLPFMVAVTSLGKLLAPIICEQIYNSPAGGGMAIGLGLILSFAGLFTIMLAINKLKLKKYSYSI
jgi:MFS family permease